jgi:hypothetical protein
LRADMAEIKHRMRAVEDQMGNLAAGEQSHYATVIGRLDRMGTAAATAWPADSR